MYYNDIPVCIVELADSWQYQSFTINKFFLSQSYPDSPFNLKEGGRVKFKIIDAYAGDNYKDIAISEFITPNYGGGWRDIKTPSNPVPEAIFFLHVCLIFHTIIYLTSFIHISY